jgi:hypothetical protein
MHRLIPAAFVMLMLAACTETSTEPNTNRAPEEHASLSVALPGTTASITSGSCNLVNSTTGEVRCSYDIANPDGILLNIYPGARLGIDYQCVNSSTGKLQSSGYTIRWATGADADGVTATNPTATDVKLSTPVVPNGYVHKDTKWNTCKGKQTLVVTNYSMVYWEVYLDNWYPGQPNADYTYTCLASDASYRGCATVLID